jgi:hypothetical protein
LLYTNLFCFSSLSIFLFRDYPMTHLETS